MTVPRVAPQASALGPGREFDRIRRIAARWARARPAWATTAPCSCPPTRCWSRAPTSVSRECTSTARGCRSRRSAGVQPPAALSDLAADGADAAGVLVALTVPAEGSDDDVASVMAGAGAAAAEVGARVVGGDLSAGPGVEPRRHRPWLGSAPVTRAGALPGDGLWVTGALGGARAALEAWQRGAEPDAGGAPPVRAARAAAPCGPVARPSRRTCDARSERRPRRRRGPPRCRVGCRARARPRARPGGRAGGARRPRAWACRRSSSRRRAGRTTSCWWRCRRRS